MKKFYNLLAVSIFLFACFVLPKAALAASLSFSQSSQQVYEGDIFTIKLNLDSQGQKVNVLEGSVVFDTNTLEVEDVSTGGSIFNLWTRSPIYNNETGKITFTGGTAQAFSGNSGNVLTLVFYAKQNGQAPVNIGVDSAVFLADGKGTEVIPHFSNSIISISAQSQNHSSVNEWDKILAADKPATKLGGVIGSGSFFIWRQVFYQFFRY